MHNRPTLLRSIALVATIALGHLTGARPTGSVLASAPPLAHSDSGIPLDNGDFEDPVLSQDTTTRYAGQVFGGWTVESGSIDQVRDTYWQTPSGHQSVDLAGYCDAGTIYQDLQTIPGRAYWLRFALAGNPVGGPRVVSAEIWWGAALIDTVSFNTSGHSKTSMGWEYLEYPVIADSYTTRLRFKSLSGQCYGPAVDAVTLLPDVPLFLQTSDPWGGEAYGNYGYGDEVNTVGKWGCNLSSSAMIIDYWGQSAPFPFHTDPELLNEWLRLHSGYDLGPKETSLEVYARQMSLKMSVTAFKGRDDTKLDAVLGGGGLAVLAVNDKGHYVVATGKVQVGSQETHAINDPIFGRTTLLAHYGNNYQFIRFFSPGAGGERLVSISAESIMPSPPGAGGQGLVSMATQSPVELLVTDPQGRRSGYDPSSDTYYNEIPNSVYFDDTLAPDGGSGLGADAVMSKELLITSALGGQYTIMAIGTGIGDYVVRASGVDQNYNTIDMLASGTASPGSVDAIEYAFIPFDIRLPLILR